MDIETDARRIYETFREDQKALDNQRRKQRLRITLDGQEFVLMRGDEEVARCDDLMDAVGRQLCDTYELEYET